MPEDQHVLLRRERFARSRNLDLDRPHNCARLRRRHGSLLQDFEQSVCTGTEPHFTYLTLGDSRDSVNNLIRGRVGSTNRSGRAVTRGAIYKECPMKCRRCGESLR